MFHNNFNPYSMSASAYIPTAQNRLNQLEMPNNMSNNMSNMPNYNHYSNYGNMPPTQSMPIMNTGNYLKGKPVTSLEEVKATPAEFDGSLNVFPDIGNNRIYTKQINNDGIAILKTYVLSENEEPVAATPTIPTEDLELLKSRLQFVEQELLCLKNEKNEVLKNEHESKKSSNKYFK